VNQIKIRFSEDVNVQAADLSLSGKNVTAYAFDSYFYDPQSHWATWTLAATLAADRLRIDLDADGIDPIRDLDGNALDGEWTNNSDTYASGNGTAGGDFEFLFNILPGDVNGSGQVNYTDYVYTRSLEGKTTTDNGYLPHRDIDGSGVIDATDWQAVLAELWDVLPTGSPAGVNNDAPTAVRVSTVSLTNHAVNTDISLWSSFDDAEDGASGLTYSIVSNSAPQLLDVMSINQSTGTLTVSGAQGASGRANIVIRGTDSGGLFVDTQHSINVNYVNQPPVISYFLAQSLPGSSWLISGTVADPDDDPTGWIVYFSGIFETRAAVWPDGQFEFVVTLDPEAWGWEDAVTFDLHGQQSNVPLVFIGLT
jgi:hypothetical protein